MKRRTSISTAIIVVVFLTLLIATSFDEIKLTISNWLGNKPKILVKLDIHIPKDAKGKCFVLVRRFPSMYNPTRDGYTEKVYAGVHRPGTVVEVKKVLNAHIVKSIEHIDHAGETKTYRYYEPQEFFVALLCKDGNTTTFKWSKVVEVYPNKIIYRKDIYPNLSTGNQTIVKAEYKRNPNTLTTTTQQIHCAITQREYIPGNYRRGDCRTWVRGPLLYSMWFVKSKFGINSYPKRSAVYFESFSDFDAGPLVKPESDVDWSSAGRKLAASTVTMSTKFLTGSYKDRIYFDVKYVYEWENECDLSAGGCDSYWLLYPKTVYGVYRSGEGPWSGILNETSNYSPLAYCQYTCHPITPGTSIRIDFYDDDNPPYENNNSIVSVRNNV